MECSICPANDVEQWMTKNTSLVEMLTPGPGLDKIKGEAILSPYGNGENPKRKANVQCRTEM
jgi:hypothetical protein